MSLCLLSRVEPMSRDPSSGRCLPKHTDHSRTGLAAVGEPDHTQAGFWDEVGRRPSRNGSLPGARAAPRRGAHPHLEVPAQEGRGPGLRAPRCLRAPQEDPGSSPEGGCRLEAPPVLGVKGTQWGRQWPTLGMKGLSEKLWEGSPLAD